MIDITVGKSEFVFHANQPVLTKNNNLPSAKILNKIMYHFVHEG